MKVIPLLISVIMVSCIEIRPLPLPEYVRADSSASVGQPPASAISCPDLEQRLPGVWLYTSDRLFNSSGGSRSNTGHLTFNTDGSIEDPDTLLGTMINGKPMIRREYRLEDGLLYVYGVGRQEEQLGVRMKLQDNQCDKPTFVNDGSGPTYIKLTRY